MARRAHPRSGGLTLDVGCGTLLFESRIEDRKQVFVGLDLSREMIEIGRSKSLENMALLVNGDAEKLPFPAGTFESVISCYVAKYVRLPAFAAELARVTKGGGTVALYDFAKPRGVAAPLLELYIKGGLRGAGFLLGLARRGSAFTYTNLPTIIDESTWDGSIVRTMEGVGFQTVAAEMLTRGAVFAYAGVKMKRA